MLLFYRHISDSVAAAASTTRLVVQIGLISLDPVSHGSSRRCCEWTRWRIKRSSFYDYTPYADRENDTLLFKRASIDDCNVSRINLKKYVAHFRRKIDNFEFDILHVKSENIAKDNYGFTTMKNGK